MSRMEEDDPRKTVSFRVRKSVRDRYKAACDDRDVSMSQDLRNHIEAVATEHDGQNNGSHLPDDPTLAKAYRILKRNTHPGTDKIRTKTAKSKLSQSIQVPENHIKPLVLQELQRRGYIQPDWGVIKVVDVTPSTEHESADA